MAAARIVEPAQPRRGVDLRVFARDLVGGDRLPRHLAHIADDVEVQPGRFHHDDVRALGFIEQRLGDRLAAVRGIQLVGRLAQQPGAGGLGAADRIAERPVIAGIELRRVSHDARARKARAIQRPPDRTDAPVHHVRRRHEIHARPRLQDRHLGQDANRAVVLDVVHRRGQHAVMAVRRVGIERDVRQNHQLRHRLFHRPDRPENQRLLVQGLRPLMVLELRVELRKQRHRRHAQLVEGPAFLDEVREVQPEHPGHGFDLLRPGLALDDEERRDEVRRAQHRLLDECAQVGGAAQAPRALG